MDKQNITDNIKVPNKNLEILKKHFLHYFDKNGNFDFEKFKKELSKNEVDFSKESYSMDWLGKSYARLLASDEARTLLKEDKRFNQKDENKKSQNLLIKGDNLEVLKHLSNSYYEKIKMIYIDPPYNTGNDGFVYQDDRKFTVEEFSKLAGVDEEKAKRILDFVDSNSNSHSAWLTFMYPRLYIAKQLLKDNGVIFVSIDDNEVAQLRILMDDVFGEENFVGDLIRKTRSSANNADAGFNIQHENGFIYARTKYLLNLKGEGKTFENYKNPDNDLNGDWISDNPTANLDKRKKINNFKIINPYTGKIDTPPNGRHWVFSQNDLDIFLKNGKLFFKKEHKEKERGFVLKRYKKDIKSSFHLLNSLECSTNDFLNQVGTKERNEMFDKDIFDYPKPRKFLTTLIQSNTNNDDLVLDFFAGSGTTGDAVMQLNAEDGENRKYILVQLPEKIDPMKNKIAYNFVKNELKVEEPTIFEITKERLIRVGKRIKEENVDRKTSSKKEKCECCEKESSVKIPEQKAKDLSNIDFGFKIFETTSIWEDYNFDAETFDPQTKLFNESVLTAEDLEILLTTWKTYDGILLTQDLKEIDLEGYTGYYFDTKLYLMDKGFGIKNLKRLLTEIDENKEFNPASVIVFGYNFESKILREIAENIKNYANKKHIDVDFITRY